MKYAPSIVPVVPKLQQDPQMPWSLIGDTAPKSHIKLYTLSPNKCGRDFILFNFYYSSPCSLQFQSCGTSVTSLVKNSPPLGSLLGRYPLIIFSSSSDRSARWLTPREYVSFLRLVDSMNLQKYYISTSSSGLALFYILDVVWFYYSQIHEYKLIQELLT